MAQDVAAVLLIIVQLLPQKEVSGVGSVCAWCMGGASFAVVGTVCGPEGHY